MNNAPPSWMHDPEVLANWLVARVRFAKNTSERLGQVSRCDAICWYLTRQVDCCSSAKDVKRFATAFRERFATTRKYDCRTKTYTVNAQALDGCFSLLNTCYGGVARDFGGKPYATWYGKGENQYKHYGDVAPLYRPMPGHYSPTSDGLRRSSRVQAMLDAKI